MEPDELLWWWSGSLQYNARNGLGRNLKCWASPWFGPRSSMNLHIRFCLKSVAWSYLRFTSEKTLIFISMIFSFFLNFCLNNFFLILSLNNINLSNFFSIEYFFFLNFVHGNINLSNFFNWVVYHPYS